MNFALQARPAGQVAGFWGIAAPGIDRPEKRQRSVLHDGMRISACAYLEVSLMKARVAAAAMLLTMTVPSAFATVRISDDRGGQIGDYLAKYHALRENGERVDDRRHLRVGMHDAVGRHSAEPDLRHAARGAGLSLRLDANVRGRADQQRGQLLPVVELSAPCAQVDHPARRIADADHLSERGEIGRDVSALSLTDSGNAADRKFIFRSRE